jgi:cell wall-associated NlpC family hydrolase
MRVRSKPKAAPAAKPSPEKKPPAKDGHVKLIHEIVRWAHWFHLHGQHMPYTETSARSGWLHEKIGDYPINTDCSGFVTLCYAWAGAHDPNGLNEGEFKPGGWHELGYTGTLLDHAHAHGHIHGDAAEALPGDLLVVGPGTGDHVMIVVEAGENPLCVSHGAEGVWYVRASQDARTPHRYCRYIKAGTWK